MNKQEIKILSEMLIDYIVDKPSTFKTSDVIDPPYSHKYYAFTLDSMRIITNMEDFRIYVIDYLNKKCPKEDSLYVFCSKYSSKYVTENIIMSYFIWSQRNEKFYKLDVDGKEVIVIHSYSKPL